VRDIFRGQVSLIYNMCRTCVLVYWYEKDAAVSTELSQDAYNFPRDPTESNGTILFIEHNAASKHCIPSHPHI
jgi:hypothetical protein